MRIVKYLCDRCGKEVLSWYTIHAFKYSEAGMAESDIREDEREFCQECTQEIFDFSSRRILVADHSRSIEIVPEPPTTEEPPADQTENVPEKQEKPKKAPKKTPITYGKPGRRSYYLNDEIKGEIKRRYEAGQEMEAIADDLMLYLPPVSRFIASEGLGKKRYEGKPIPSKGGAPIMQTVALNPIGKARER